MAKAGIRPQGAAGSPVLPRRGFLCGGLASGVAAGLLPARPVWAEVTGAAAPSADLILWFRLVLELVRHTPTYSPPVAARAFGYLGVTAWETIAALDGKTSLSGQLNGLSAIGAPVRGLDPAAVMHGAMAAAALRFFSNTGPTGQRAMQAMDRKLGEALSARVGAEAMQAGVAAGRAMAEAVASWAEGDGGAVVENLGFPDHWTLGTNPGSWVPTNAIRLQQTPLLPHWGQNRPMAMKAAADCGLPAPIPYSEEPGSEFHAQAMEVYQVSQALTEEQKLIARFWSDDPMLSPTPPGHWISILLDIAERDGLPVDRLADALARLGVAQNDALICCWAEKFRHDLLRPVTYINRVIDAAWQPLLITPPFPEYPSGHSTQSGAASAVLDAIFGPDFAFDDATHVDDGLPVRSFVGFRAAAEEAAMSRLYGGIHFRAANEQGLAQGVCVAAHAIGLKTL